MARYLIGIDLGTTNSALAYIDLQGARGQGRGRDSRPVIQPFPIPQLVAPGDVGRRPLLPSFLYLPGPHDLPAGGTALPWHPDRAYAVGEFARSHGARVPGRLVTSAKSWLCHAGVDRSAPLLPWSALPDVARISPVEASARFLQHLIESWNHVMARDRPDDQLEKQTVVLTVPASFDDVARNLTVEAARHAGIDSLILLEEPQAAFYCWLATHSAQDVSALKPGSRCLVVDVGGGTSDFSLIQAVEHQGELGFVRQAVGDHLLLGGDNMDLALAKFVETRLPGAGSLDAAQYGLLTQACRQAKEILLGPEPPPAYTVTVMGRGRQVVGGAQHATLSPAEVRQVLFEGFFPLVPSDAEPQRGPRSGLHEMGLPYVSDPAISRHLAAFLRRHAPQRGSGSGEPGKDEAADMQTQQHGDAASAQKAESRRQKARALASCLVPCAFCPLALPDAVLLNGGVFQPAPLRERLLAVLHHWYDAPDGSWQPLVLANPSLDLAVAWGAAHYAWLRHSGGRRIGGGMARSYYLAVEPDDAETRPGEDAAPQRPVSVLCVVPQRLEEGQEIALDRPELELALGRPVVFPLYTSTVRGADHAGDVISLMPEQLLQLPPLHTLLRGGKRSGTKSVPVTLAARCTEIGTLELWCVAKEGNNRWRLEFNVRDVVPDADRPHPDASRPSGEHQDGGPQGGEGGVPARFSDVWPELQVQEAARLIQAAYSEAGGLPPDPKQLTKALESALEAPRYEWPTGLCRRLWEFLAEVAEQRRRSPAHLSRWYHLVGYCLRPGFGDPLDRYRVEQLWKIMHSPPRSEAGKTAPRLAEGGADYWIMWRRIAGGLSNQLQNALFNRLRPVLLPGKGKGTFKPGANELAEMWRAAASLERLDVKQKEALGQVLLKALRRSPAPTYAFWALTRLGARVLLYGPLNAVVHRQVAEQWLDAILGRPEAAFSRWQSVNDSERLAWAFCLAQIARRTGQRALDIDDSHRHRVLTMLRPLSVPPHWMKMVEEVSELEGEEQSQMFGEALPIGLRLARIED